MNTGVAAGLVCEDQPLLKSANTPGELELKITSLILSLFSLFSFFDSLHPHLTGGQSTLHHYCCTPAA